MSLKDVDFSFSSELTFQYLFGSICWEIYTFNVKLSQKIRKIIKKFSLEMEGRHRIRAVREKT